MVGPTVDPRAEPVPEIHSIEKVSKTIQRKGITNPKIRKKTKRKTKHQTAMDRSPKGSSH